LRHELSHAQPFPLDSLGDVLGDAARAIVDKVQCADALAGSSVLAVASLATQAHANVVIPATGQARPLSLFLVSVASSGERKTAADAEALRPIREWEKILRERYDDDHRKFKQAKLAYDEAVKRARKAEGGVEEVQRAIAAIGDEPSAPLKSLLTCDEPSAAGLSRLFVEGHPTLGLFSDEGGSFVGGHALTHNRLKTMATLSSLWDGHPLRVTRAGSGIIVLPGRRLAMHLMLQPRVAERLLGDEGAEDQGILSRVLVCMPESTAGTRFQRELDPETLPSLERYNSRIRELLEAPLPAAQGATGGLSPRELRFSPEAMTRWRQISNETEARIGPGGELERIKAFASKLPEHISRIAGVLSLVDEPATEIVELETLERAIVVGAYYASEVLRALNVGRVRQQICNAEKLLDWLKEWPEPQIGLAAIYQLGPYCVRPRDAAIEAVALLERHGWLIPLPGDSHRVRGKLVKKAWRLVRTS
jgi:hypothetical protein